MSDEDPPAETGAEAVRAAAAALGRKGGLAKSAKKRKAVRVAALKHGRDAKALTNAEKREAMLRKIDPDAPEVLAAVRDAMAGNLEAYQRLGLEALGDAEILRRASVRSIKKRGALVKSVTTTEDGRTIETWKAHPLMDHARRLHGILGYTADEMQLTAKSRGQGAKDAAATALLERLALLRGANKNLAPMPDAIETTAVR